ncbi:UDP-2,3-diacylglucosamine diphosphatase [Chryseobacterium koreense]|uniref:Phosphoesterase n=1 Tax=Chryseobacterium koreense CCUG 49689 TaxID=1304281 RepID=A0A0J7LTP5_9FLAO|nr:UDP-2,3-diacylglucosamine diphosphatase [Chryseobacterium koreense]KMQ72310.1 phosphoesterase [Chryseobacterium koreense CCUG 49689]MBB5333998.1 UDP-2,3-diacylglucosamine pyrophosphatase LpxH [Chryseobacterium koreense]
MEKRNIPIVVLSDIHLATYGCHATQLVAYLKSINPKLLILNGDIIDGWAFSKKYFPNSHMAVLSEFFKMMKNGTEIIYITGNHDEFLRKYSDLTMGNLFLTDKYLVEIDGKKTWFFHGDIFDHTTKGGAKFIAKIGGIGYDWLILINRAINFLLENIGQKKISLSKKIKNSVKNAVKFIADFEEKAIALAIENKYDYVVCGHIHQPADRIVTNEKGTVHYLNSGDWIENLSYLEYQKGKWELLYFDETKFEKPEIEGNDITVNVEELIHPPIFAAFVGAKI